MLRLMHLIHARLSLLGSAWRAADVLERDVALKPPTRISANGSCRILRCLDGEAALNMARPDDWDLVPALTGSAGQNWADIQALAARMMAADFVALAAEYQLPVARLGEAEPLALVEGPIERSRLRVLDMSALWAGPLCGALLAEAGAEVVRLVSVGRVDPTEANAPCHFARLHAGKSAVSLDLRTRDGRDELLTMIAGADVLITSGRAAALKRLGLGVESLLCDQPDLIWCAISGHGFLGAMGTRVGFGDDAAFAGGLVARQGGHTHFVGDALADPLTGLESALAVLSAARDGRAGLLDMPLARVAAAYAARLA